MTINHNIKKGGSRGKKIAAGIGIGFAVAGAVAAAYALTGERGKRNRQKISAWAKKMKADVARELKKFERVDKTIYHGIVDALEEKYRMIKGVDIAAIASIARELRSKWEQSVKAAPESATAKRKSSTKKK